MTTRDELGGLCVGPHRIARARVVPPEHVYPVDDWRIVEKRFTPRHLAQAETIFALANGYLGLRGDFEEGAPVCDGGVLLNGFYESWPIVYGEEAYGFARTGQTLVNVPDGKMVRLYVDDEPFEIEKANLVHFERVLDMRAGTLDREILWENPAGKRIRIRSRRMVSIVHRHLALVDYEVTVENRDAHLLVVSELANRVHGEEDHDDPRRSKRFDARVLEPLGRSAEGLRAVLRHRTRNSRLEIGCGIDHALETECFWTRSVEESPHAERIVFSVEAEPGKPFHLTKFLAYHYAEQGHAGDLAARARRTLSRAAQIGAERLFEEQRERVEEFWNQADVQIEGDPTVQQFVRFSLFQLFQATARVEGHGVPAKGLTGRGYEGHYFWDTEIYVMPFLTYTAPGVARNLLRFRHRLLDAARARAAELGHAGALFPWRTINGEEASAYYAAGTAQYHINADIAHALRKYVLTAGDVDFMRREGAEILVETARLWADLGTYSEARGGAFCINGVTGPDEYTAVVDNNRFTNMMARENLRTAAFVVERMQEQYPEDFAVLAAEADLDLAELDDWRRAAERMYLPIDEKTGIHPQDDSFLQKQSWDFAATPPEKYPLLLHYHPLVIYRHQVIKQADVVLAMFLLERDFSPEETRRNFDYYDPLTTHDSTLSTSIQSIVACEIGYVDKAFEYFLDSAAVDLADVGGNVNDGAHVAAAGGVWMALVYGFAGMRDEFGVLSFQPRLPEHWKRLRFPLTVAGQTLDVDLADGSVTYTLRAGAPLGIRHEDRELLLEAGKPVSAECTAVG